MLSRHAVGLNKMADAYRLFSAEYVHNIVQSITYPRLEFQSNFICLQTENNVHLSSDSPFRYRLKIHAFQVEWEADINSAFSSSKIDRTEMDGGG